MTDPAADTEKSALKNWATVGGFTFASRIAGCARDLAVAYFLGAGAQSDAFYVAFRIPNLLRRLFAEGMLQAAFIPVFTAHIRQRGRSGSEGLGAVFAALAVILGAAVILATIFAPQIISLFASGFDAQSFDLAVRLLRLMFPYIIFVSLAAASMGALNSVGHFFAPAAAPLLFNLVFIAALFFFHDQWAEPATAAALGVLAGGALAGLFQFPFLKRRGLGPNFGAIFAHSQLLKKMGVLMLPQLFGVAVYHLNILVNTQYASYMDGGTVSYLYFAERLTEFPLGIGAVAIATALFPRLSLCAAENDTRGFRENFSGFLRMALFITLPAAAGLAALAFPICGALFERGQFTGTDALFSSQALVGYSAGLWAVAGIRLAAPAFFALGDTKTPAVAAAAGLAVNLILGYGLGFELGLKHTGLALASSAAAAVNFLILLYLLNKRVGNVVGTGFARWLFTAAAISAACAAAAKILYETGKNFIPEDAALAAAIAASAAVFMISARAAKIAEAEKLTSLLLGKRG